MRQKITQNIWKATVRMASSVESMGMSTRVVIPAIEATLPVYTNSIQPQWHAFTNYSRSHTTDIPQVDLSEILHGASAMTSYFMDSFTQAQKEKETRAENMMGPVVREITRKTSEVLSSPEETTRLKEELSGSQEQFKENKKQIKHLKNTASLIQKAIGSELAEVLKSKIDSNTLNTFCKALKISSKVATQTIPALRVLNNLSLAYEAAKALYPEQAQAMENYLINALQPQEKVLAQDLSDKAPLSQRINTSKQALIDSFDAYEQHINDQISESENKATEHREDNLPSGKHGVN